MEDGQINELVKNLELHFFGYTAKKNRLKNDSGLEFLFQDIWGKTTISGLGGKECHSIGCSFTKPLEKIAKDIKRRRLPAYRDDFLNTRKSRTNLRKKRFLTGKNSQPWPRLPVAE